MLYCDTKLDRRGKIYLKGWGTESKGQKAYCNILKIEPIHRPAIRVSKSRQEFKERPRSRHFSSSEALKALI
jgi:hypothetical protein